MPTNVRFLLDDNAIRDTLDHLSWPHTSYPSTSMKYPRSALRKIPRPLHSDSPTSDSYSAFPSNVSALGHFTQQKSELAQDKGRSTYFDQVHCDLVGHRHSSGESSTPLSTTTTFRNEMRRNLYDIVPVPEDHDETHLESTSASLYLEMATPNRRRRMARVHTSDSDLRPSSYESSITPLGSPVRQLSSSTTTLHQAKHSSQADEYEISDCQVLNCGEQQLDWSSYCYRHQCRAFLCYGHVLRSSTAYCEKHHQDADPELVS